MEETEDTTVTRLNAARSGETKTPEKVDRLSITSNGLTDIGNKRLHNEDALFCSDAKSIWMVADGVGGHNAGDLASRSLAENIAKFKPSDNVDDSVDTLEFIIKNTNQQLVEKAAEIDDSTIIGSTVVLLVACKSEGAVLWAGDSRLYRIRDENIEQITQDHSLVNEMINKGDLDAEDIESYPDSNKITRAIGFKKNLLLDHRKLSILPGDRYILCSDGLTKYLDENEILSTSHGESVETSNHQLLQKALDAGGLDNITTITVEFNAG